MKRIVSLGVILAAAVVSAGLARYDSASAATQGSKGKKSDVAAVYQAQCAKCHGADGKGIESLPDIPNFSDAAWQAAHPDKDILASIKNGKGIMPGYKDTLSAADMTAMVKHVRSFGKKK